MNTQQKAPTGQSQTGATHQNYLDGRAATNVRSASVTTAVTVVPSSRDFATAACHTSSGIRIERGIVAMSEVHDFEAVIRCTPAAVFEEDREASLAHRVVTDSADQSLAFVGGVDGLASDDVAAAADGVGVEGVDCCGGHLGPPFLVGVSTLYSFRIYSVNPWSDDL